MSYYLFIEVNRNSQVMLTNHPFEVRTLLEPEISIIDTGQAGKDFMMV